MSDYWHDVRSLKDFRIDNLSRDDERHIRLYLLLMNTKPNSPSQYLVTASPNSAKCRVSNEGGTLVATTWPEVVLGFIVEVKVDSGKGEKQWELHPTLKSGKGWRKKSIMRWNGRNRAAKALLSWWTLQNNKEQETQNV